jgi:hypothetical protein
MSRGRRVRVVLPIAAVGLAAVGTGAALNGPIAAGLRDLFTVFTPGRVAVLLGVVVAAVLLLALAARISATPVRGVATPRSLTAIVDRLEWPVAVAILCAVAGVAWYALGRATTVPRIFADELIHGEAARNLALHGSLATHGYGFLTPAIDSLAYLATSSDVTAYRLVQAMNVVVMVTAAFIAYPLARRAMSNRWALVVAGLTLVVPWLTYARFVLTEPDFYPVFLLFALALVRALEHPTPRRQAVVLAALLLTYLTRTQAVALAGAVICAVPLYGIAQGHLRATLKAFAPTWALYAAGAVIVALAAGVGLWSPLGPYRPLLDGLRHPHGLAIWVAANLSSLFLGLGVLVGVGAPLGAAMMLRRTASSGAAALAAVTVTTTAALLASVSLLSESVYGQGSVHERDLFFAAPLVISCAIAWATSGCPRPRLLTAATALIVVGLAAVIPANSVTPHSADALSFKLWSHVHPAGLSAVGWIVVATLAGALAVLSLRAPWPIIVTVALAAVGVAAASDYRSAETRSDAGHYTWVDRAVPGSAEVTLVYIGYSQADCPAGGAPSPLPAMSLYTEYFNSRIDLVGHLLADNAARGLASAEFQLRPDGIVTENGLPVRSGYAVTDARIAVAGSRVATLSAREVSPRGETGTGSLALWRLRSPLRLVHPSQVEQPAAATACG